MIKSCEGSRPVFEQLSGSLGITVELKIGVEFLGWYVQSCSRGVFLPRGTPFNKNWEDLQDWTKTEGLNFMKLQRQLSPFQNEAGSQPSTNKTIFGRKIDFPNAGSVDRLLPDNRTTTKMNHLGLVAAVFTLASGQQITCTIIKGVCPS